MHCKQNYVTGHKNFRFIYIGAVFKVLSVVNPVHEWCCHGNSTCSLTFNYNDFGPVASLTTIKFLFFLLTSIILANKIIVVKMWGPKYVLHNLAHGLSGHYFSQHKLVAHITTSLMTMTRTLSDEAVDY